MYVDLAIVLQGLTIASVLMGAGAVVTMRVFGLGRWSAKNDDKHEQLEKDHEQLEEDFEQAKQGWSKAEIRIGNLADRFTGVLNELQVNMTASDRRAEERARERDIAIHRRLDEHVNSDNVQFGEVLRSLGNIEGMLKARGKA